MIKVKHLNKEIIKIGMIFTVILAVLTFSNRIAYADENEPEEIIIEEMNLLDGIEKIYEDDNTIEVPELMSGQTSISWSLKNDSIKYTKGFYKKAGTKLSINLRIVPNTQKVKIGYSDSEKKLHSIEGKSALKKTFTINKSGNIRVFVMNTSGKKVTVAGYYIK